MQRDIREPFRMMEIFYILIGGGDCISVRICQNSLDLYLKWVHLGVSKLYDNKAMCFFFFNCLLWIINRMAVLLPNLVKIATHTQIWQQSNTLFYVSDGY